MKNKIVAGVVVALALVSGLAFYWPFGSGRALKMPGIVEIQEVRLGSKVGGRVLKVLAEEGKEMNPGDSLVILEVPELENQHLQKKARVEAAKAELERAMKGARVEERKAAKATAAAAKARYDRMVEGWREEEKRQAASDLETSDADLKHATEEFERITRLYRVQSASRTEYDAAMGVRDRARGRVNVARAKVDMIQKGNRVEDVAEMKAEWDRAAAKAEELENGTRPEDIALAKSKVDEATAKLQELEINLREATIKMPAELGKAIVEVVAVRPGDLVAAGQPVVRVLRTQDLWVKIFVPETQLGQVPLYREVEVRIDTFPDKKLRGVVRQRASSSEFTPRNVQSLDERRYQVFGVKIRVDDPQGILNAGMAAEVVIPLE
jgi:HlyD family secretion protein